MLNEFNANQQPTSSGDMSRHDGTCRDIADGKSSLSDNALGIAQIPAEELRYTLTLDDLEHQFRIEGITKTRRTLQRYLEKGHIKAAKLDSGKWVANAPSVADFIEDKKRQEALAMELSRDRHQDALQHELAQTRPDTTRHDATRHDATSPDTYEQAEVDDTNELEKPPVSNNIELLVENARLQAQNEQLEARLTDKDDELKFARKQVTEANRAAERAFSESYQYKALLAARDDQFRPMLESISELSRRSDQRKLEFDIPTPDDQDDEEPMRPV